MSFFARRRQILIGLCASPSLVSVPSVMAQAPTEPREGVDYKVLLNPQPTDPPGKIEVLDFFWYGCPHCFALLPDLEAWRKKLPSDVAYKHVAVDFGDPAREAHTRIFYTLQVLNRVDDLHVKVFEAYHDKRQRLLNRDEIADFMASNGISRDKWLAAYDSFSVAGAVNRARLTTQAYTIDGTPTLACDGRFLTAPSMVQSHTNSGTLAVMDYLLERVRRERARKKA